MNVTNEHNSIIRSFWFQPSFSINFYHDEKVNVFACHLLTYRDNIDGRNNKQEIRCLWNEVHELKYGLPSYHSALTHVANLFLASLDISFEKFVEIAEQYRSDPGISEWFK